MGKHDEVHEADDFQPKGAVAFFVVMIVFYTIIWFLMYFELLSRV